MSNQTQIKYIVSFLSTPDLCRPLSWKKSPQKSWNAIDRLYSKKRLINILHQFCSWGVVFRQNSVIHLQWSVLMAFPPAPHKYLRCIPGCTHKHNYQPSQHTHHLHMGLVCSRYTLKTQNRKGSYMGIRYIWEVSSIFFLLKCCQVVDSGFYGLVSYQIPRLDHNKMILNDRNSGPWINFRIVFIYR